MMEDVHSTQAFRRGRSRGVVIRHLYALVRGEFGPLASCPGLLTSGVVTGVLPRTF